MDNSHHPYKVGSIVELRSGSVHMVVERVDGDNVSLLWYDNGQLQRSTVPAIAIRWPQAGEHLKSVAR